MITKPIRRYLSVLNFLISGIAVAGTPISHGMINSKTAEVYNYWTEERLREAMPMELTQVDHQQMTRLSPEELKEKFASLKPQHTDASPPTIQVSARNNYLFKPNKAENNNMQFFDSGSKEAPFSSSQLVPISADLHYPYTTVGKLFFTTPNGDKTCTAAVIANRLILTAGACLHNGNGNASGWYRNWMFIPAYRSGNAPFEAWTWSAVKVAAPWFDGGGNLPNTADFGLVELEDLPISGERRTIASVVGRLGTQTLMGSPNHAHILGYPLNFDNGQLMHQVTSTSAFGAYSNNIEYGSDMFGGGVGGSPLIQNFGIASAGQNGGSNPARNSVIAVNSYMYSDAKVMLNGSSILNSNFIEIFNELCSHKSGNC
ncbi:MAG: hypothetical protein HYX60_11585 [Legionella longbeachae]|nr:hypothetical protein [Legionella longbeachae]